MSPHDRAADILETFAEREAYRGVDAEDGFSVMAWPAKEREVTPDDFPRLALEARAALPFRVDIRKRVRHKTRLRKEPAPPKPPRERKPPKARTGDRHSAESNARRNERKKEARKAARAAASTNPELSAKRAISGARGAQARWARTAAA